MDASEQERFAEDQMMANALTEAERERDEARAEVKRLTAENARLCGALSEIACLGSRKARTWHELKARTALKEADDGAAAPRE